MERRERRDLPQQFPRISEGDLLLAQARVEVGTDKADFTQRVYWEEMVKEDTYLHLGIGINRMMLQHALPPETYKEMRKGLLYGAAYFYSILRELNKEGYSFHKISGDTVTTLEAEREHSLIVAARRLRGRDKIKDSDDLEEVLHELDKVKKETEHEPLTDAHIFGENPSLQQLFEPLSMYEKAGARAVYNLKRRQHSVDGLNKLFYGNR
jgi:hypothetical protein